MDFGYLLDLAKKNEEHAKEAVQVKRYSTQVSASKKETRSGVQSDGIRNFLAKKDLEEKQKRELDKIKKDKLLSLRSQDRKSNARVQAMLKRTKAANKAVLDEARNSLNTAVTAEGLEKQPDEDDYGYVSHEASEFYKKLMNKYSSNEPEDTSSKYKVKTKNELSSAKDRVKDALHKIEEEELAAPVRKRRTTKPKAADVRVTMEKAAKVKTFKEPEKKKIVKSRAKVLPPEAALSFDQILKLAAVKQHEPVKLDVDVKKTLDEERLMTKKEREDYLRRKEEERDRQLRKEGKLPPLSAKPPAPPTPSLQATTSKSSKEPKSQSNNSKGNIKTDVNVNVKPAAAAAKNAVGPSGRLDAVPDKGNGGRTGANRMDPVRMKKSDPVPLPSRAATDKGKALAPGGSRAFPPYREERPHDHHFKRRLESDEEEYDSELDDFIDDGPEESNEYSKYIKEIFNYDRSRYRIESDEDDCMESNFAQQMNEERISTKIGIMEDLEEERIQREEETKKKKLLKRTKTK